MDYPFIDTTSLSDDELMRRIQRCHQIMSGEMSMGHSSMVHSARSQLEVYQFEWDQRMQAKARKDFIERNPNADKVIEIGTVAEYYDPEEKYKEEGDDDVSER